MSLFADYRATHSYAPRNLGIVTGIDEPVYKFLIVREKNSKHLIEIIRLFSDHGVQITLPYSSYDEDRDAIVASYYCNFKDADCEVEEIAKSLRGLPYVMK